MTRQSGFIGGIPVQRSAASIAASQQAAAAFQERQEAQRAAQAAEAARRATAARQARERAQQAQRPQPAAPARHSTVQPKPLQPGDTRVTVVRGPSGRTYHFGNRI